MKKTIHTFLVLISISFSLHAQSFWKRYSPQYNLTTSSVLTDDNGLMIASLTSDSVSALPHILRIDSNGSIVFSLQSYYPLDSVGGSFYDIIKTRDGNYLAMGSWGNPQNLYGVLLHKFDLNGNTIWDRFIYNDSCIDQQLGEAFTIIETNDNGYALSGMSYKFPIPGPIPALFILKTDSLGFPVWYKIYSTGKDLYRMENNICEKSNGGFVAFEQINGQQDAIIISTDKDGNVQSSFTMDSTNQSRLQGIYNFHGEIYFSFYDGFTKTNLDTNAFSFTTYTDSSNSFTIKSMEQCMNHDILLTFREFYFTFHWKFGSMRIDTSGNIVWAHGFYINNVPQAIHELPDRRYFFNGISNNGNIYFNDIMKLDTTGNFPCFNDPLKIVTHTVIEKLTPYPVSVDSCRLSTIPLNLSWHNVGTDSVFCIPNGIDEIEKISTSVFPNPASGILYIKSKNPLREVYLYDILGNRIINEKMQGEINSLDVSFLSAGIYLCRIITRDGENFVKVILNK